jgi:hypothetical protein
MGFERENVLAIAPSLRLSGYDSVRQAAFTREFEERLASIPSLRSVAHGDLPTTQATRTTFDGGAVGGTPLEGFYSMACHAYFETLGIAMIRGRAFTQEECRTEAPVAVVSGATAKALWPNGDAINRTLILRSPKGIRRGGTPVPDGGSPEERRVIVVGVVRDAQTVELGSIPGAYAYLPGEGGSLAARPSTDVRVATVAILAATRAIDPNVPVSIMTLDDVMANRTGLGSVKLAAGFGAGTGLLALALAVVGILGLVGYAVAQRTREFGIRMALGARSGDVMRLVLKDGLRIVAIGGILGLAGGAASARLLTGLLFGMSPLDPIAFGSVTFLLVAVTLAACYWPARRATRVDPVIALRQE